MLFRNLAIVFVLFSTTSYAADGSSENRSSTIMDSVYLNYFATFNGPGLEHLDNTNALNSDGRLVNNKTANGHMNFDSEITAAYLITPSIGVGPVVPFVFYPTQGYGAVLGDVGIKTFDKHLFQTASTNIYANIIFQIPSSDYSKNNGMDFAIKTTPAIRHNISGSRFAVGAWTEAKTYLGVKNKIKSFKLFADPYVNYQMSRDLSLNLGFEMEASHLNAVATPLDFKMVKTDLQPGIIYMITPRVMVNPFIQIFTSEKVALDRTALSAVLSASL